MTLTPRQITAYLDFSDRLVGIDRSYALAIAVVGAQGDDKAITNLRKEIIGPGNEI